MGISFCIWVLQIIFMSIGAMPDHIHILVGYNVNQLIPDLVEEIKTSSNSWIKVGKFSKFKFEWHKGYGAFTHSLSQIDPVAKYILTQEEHHKRKPFKEEYLGILLKNNTESSRAHWLRRARKLGSPLLAAESASKKIHLRGSKILRILLRRASI